MKRFWVVVAHVLVILGVWLLGKLDDWGFLMFMGIFFEIIAWACIAWERYCANPPPYDDPFVIRSDDPRASRPKPPSVEAPLRDARPIVRSEVTGLDHLLTFNGRQFEVEMVNFLKVTGYSDVKRIGGPGDRGVDITCRNLHNRLVAVQCKRYAPGRPINSGQIQMFNGMIVRNGARGLYITTSRYTAEARKLAQELEIDLIDGDALDKHYNWPRYWRDAT